MERFLVIVLGALFWALYISSLDQQKSHLQILISEVDAADNETCFSIDKIFIHHDIWPAIAVNFTMTVLERGRIVTGIQSNIHHTVIRLDFE